MVGAHDIRRLFLEFFEQRKHVVVPSSPLVPQNDPTLLFTNAGMNQFKDVFVGRETRPYVRAASSQKCLRAGGKHNDLDNVGFTPIHQTFFEMLGNFSFGDYFKEDAIAWGWEFLTERLGLPADRLCVSIYDGTGEDAPFDQEAYDLWAKILPKDRIYPLNAKENFWQMADTGPCGPCSEIHIFHGDKAPGDAGKKGKGPDIEEDAYTELWNLVFMQYEKHLDGSMTPLPKPSIDTGAGLERVAGVCAGVRSNYETDLLAPLVKRGMELAGVKNPKEPAAFQVIADHARATAFLIADGVFPDRKDRAYVLRRIMRRAIRHGTRVGLDEPFFHEVCKTVIDEFEHAYPELRAAQATIEQVVRGEEEAFRRTLDRGLSLFDQALGELADGTKEFPVAVAGKLYDTYGFPVDLTGVMAEERGLQLDENAVAVWVSEKQGAGGQKLEGGGVGVADGYFEVAEQLGRKQESFLGYDAVEADVQVEAIMVDGEATQSAGKGARVEVVFDQTPFYAESGGQMGDTGSANGDGVELRFDDTKKPTAGVHFHVGEVTSGTLKVGHELTARVDVRRRDAIRRNHSATHLLHHALRAVLGTHVIQKGSLVAPDRLRFDFSHGKAVTSEEIDRIEAMVGEFVLANADTSTREMSLDDAKASGAIGLFGEKYDADVRVVTIGDDSVELCGGTHVRRAGDIGLMKVVSEGGIAQGVRRIEAVTGAGALTYVQSMSHVLDEVSAELHAATHAEVLERFEKQQTDLKKKDREIQNLKRQLATGGAAEDVVHEVEGIKLLAKKIGIADPKAMRDAADTLRDRLGTGVVVLGGERDGKANLLVAVTKDLKDRVHAGKLVGALAPHVDGRGGGRPDLAQAGGPNPAGIDKALEAAKAALGQQLSG
jgi:alanyl-tRNA synthetase